MKEVLVDLSAANEGYTGIGQDSRMIFSMLQTNPDISLSGLVYPIGRPIIPRLRKYRRDDPARIAAIIHGVAISWGEERTQGFFGGLQNFFRDLGEALRTRHRIKQIPDWMKTDALWRLLFQRSLLPRERQRLLSPDYFVSDTSYFQMHDRTMSLGWLPYKSLDARGFDAVVFPYPRPLRLLGGVKRIVRYHDAIPLTHADTVVHHIDVIRFYKYTKIVARDGIFVCNSPMSLDDLDNIAPGAGERAVVIPCAIQPPIPERLEINVQDILNRRISLRSIGVSDAAGHRLRDSIAQSLQATPKFRYIISVSALEPRKNFVNAIAAWEIMRRRTNQDIKYVIVGSGGWKLDVTYAAMRPHILTGNIVHVENVELDELQVLYEGAECCLFPSYAEGFGYAPLEALRMGTPSVVSTLPVFRWSLGDAALFADPYDSRDISRKLEMLIDVPENKPQRDMIKQQARAVLERFSVDTISARWRAFFREEADSLSEKPIRSLPPR